MNLKDSQVIWPPKEALKYILNIYEGLNSDFLIGTVKSSEQLKVNIAGDFNNSFNNSPVEGSEN